MTTDTPAELLDELASLRERTRSARHAYWFPLILFGLLTVGSIPFYVQPLTRPPCPPEGCPPFNELALRMLGPFTALGGQVAPHPTALAGYWLGALVGGYLATFLWYRRHARRVGVAIRSTTYLVVGMATLLGYAVVAVPYLWLVQIRGRGAYLIIAAGLLVLVVQERSRMFTAIVLTYVATALVANTDLSNLLYRLGWDTGRYNQVPGEVLTALVLLTGGTIGLLRTRRTRA
jgi:hypothetical protein